MRKFDPTLYFITDSTNYTEEEFLFRVEQALNGGATLLQLREKEKSTREYIELAEKVHEITKQYNVPLVIDDRVTELIYPSRMSGEIIFTTLKETTTRFMFISLRWFRR